MPSASPISSTTSWPGVRALPATASSPLESASSHRASMSPPERIGLVSVCSRSRSASFREPADTSGTSGSRSSSIPSRLLSFRSSSFQSMSFSVLSIFQLLTPVMKKRDEDGQPYRGFGGGYGHHKKDKDEPV